MGKRKREIEFVQDKQHRMVTFSKRRQGLFKKAEELSKLSGCEIAIITFSGAGKPFTFGSSDLETIIDRYLSNNNTTPIEKLLPHTNNHLQDPMDGANQESEELLFTSQRVPSSSCIPVATATAELPPIPSLSFEPATNGARAWNGCSGFCQQFDGGGEDLYECGFDRGPASTPFSQPVQEDERYERGSSFFQPTEEGYGCGSSAHTPTGPVDDAGSSPIKELLAHTNNHLQDLMDGAYQEVEEFLFTCQRVPSSSSVPVTTATTELPPSPTLSFEPTMSGACPWNGCGGFCRQFDEGGEDLYECGFDNGPASTPFSQPVQEDERYERGSSLFQPTHEGHGCGSSAHTPTGTVDDGVIVPYDAFTHGYKVSSFFDDKAIVSNDPFTYGYEVSNFFDEGALVFNDAFTYGDEVSNLFDDGSIEFLGSFA